MPSNKIILASAAFAALTALSGQAFAATDPTGVWLNDTGRGAVEISKCGSNLCGKVVWVKDSADSDGCGKQILGDVAPVGGGVYDNGWIYSPERKKKYDVELTPLNNGTLKVMGYAGMKFLSKTMIWKKAPADLVRCDKEDTVAAAAPEKTEAPAKSVTDNSETKTSTEAADAAPETKSDTAESKDEPANDEVASSENEGGIDTGEIADKLGKFLKKGANGKCKLDLPWVKVDFDCGNK